MPLPSTQPKDLPTVSSKPCSHPIELRCRLVAAMMSLMNARMRLLGALDIYTEKMFDVIRQTNFDLAMSEFLLDLCVGTAVMLIQPGDDEVPVRFTSVPQYLVSLEEETHGLDRQCISQDADES